MSSGVRPLSDSSSTALNRYGNSSRLTTNPGMSGTSTGVLPRDSHRRRARSRVSALASGGNASSIELHPRHRVERMQADEALGVPAGVRQLGDRQRGGRGGEHGAGAGVAGELAEVRQHRGLAAVVLDDRLDQEGGGGQLVEIGHDPDAVGIEALQLRARLRHARAGALGRVIRSRPQQHVAVFGGGDRQATGDDARAGDSYSFPQVSSCLVGLAPGKLQYSSNESLRTRHRGLRGIRDP